MAERVCPVWIGYLLMNPLRKLFQNPVTILSPFITEGMTVADIGSAMGFFSLPMAQMVGPKGSVICVDMQEKMLQSLEKRARKAGLSDRIITKLCRQDSLGLEERQGAIDFVLISAVVHEVPDPLRLFAEIAAALKPGGKALVAEPAGHVSAEDFEKSLSLARQQGFKVIDTPHIGRSHTALLQV